MKPLSDGEFADLMAPLGPFGAAPHLAVAVSGGPDSLALVHLAAEWARRNGGRVTALILDHGLRIDAASEAETARNRLDRVGIAARIFRLHGVATGAGLPARARRARHARLAAAAAEIGAPWLLLGHQLADQAETLLERSLSHSGPIGLAGMAARRESARVAILRPLLSVPPGRLIATLAARKLDWARDPSNADSRFLRARLRGLRADSEGQGCASSALGYAATEAARARAAAEGEWCRILGERASIFDTGYALISPGPIAAGALALLIRTIGGAAYAPSEARLAALALSPRPCSLAGVRLIPAGRQGPGWILVREASAMSAPVPAIPGVRWDGRFCLAASARPPIGAMLGPLGRQSVRLRGRSPLPAAVLETLPALRLSEELLGVPHLGYPSAEDCACVPVRFCPNEPSGVMSFAAMDRVGDADPLM